jgi:hypothetical protein
MAKKALVSPDEPVLYISAWTPDVSTENYTPTLTTIVNGARIAQVVEPDATFDIGEPMFWVDCNDDNMADCCYYDTSTNTIILKPEDAVYPDSQNAVYPDSQNAVYPDSQPA